MAAPYELCDSTMNPIRAEEIESLPTKKYPKLAAKCLENTRWKKNVLLPK
jgi:hypothetical protein